MKGYIRIGGAMVLGIAVVASAFFLRPTGPANTEGMLNVAKAPTREFIEARDNDNDGIKDWEEALINNTWKAADLTATGSAEVYTKPETLTDQFAQSFFEDFMRSKTGNALPRSKEEFLQASVNSIEKKSLDTLYTQNDIVVTKENDEFAYRQYGNNIAEILDTYSIDNENEAAILARSLDANDPKMLAELVPIRKVYERYIEDTLRVPVPSSFLKEHLDLLNTYKAILTDIVAMEKAFSDPLYTLARMKRYEDDAAGLYIALSNIHVKLKKLGIIYANDEPGSLFYFFET